MVSFQLTPEVDQLFQEDAWNAGRQSKTLVKLRDFQIVLIVMKANAIFPEHKTTGGISVYTISGRIRVRAEGRLFDLAAGHVLALERLVAHDVEALEDSAFLLTVARPEGATKS